MHFDKFRDMIEFKESKGIQVWNLAYDAGSGEISLKRMRFPEMRIFYDFAVMDNILDRLESLRDTGAIVFGDLETDFVRDPRRGIANSSLILDKLLPIFDRLKSEGLVKYRYRPDLDLSWHCYVESEGIQSIVQLGHETSGSGSFIIGIILRHLLSLPDTSSIYIDHGIEGTLLNSLIVEDEKDNHDIDSLLLCDEKPLTPHGYAVVGMSGSGKSTLIRHLLGYVKNIFQATKYTTRESRGSIEPGVKIVSDDDFEKLLRKNEFAATYVANGKAYGYRRDEIEASMRAGIELFFDTTNIGFACDLKEAYPDYVKTVLVQSDTEFSMGNLVKRYREIPDDLTSVYDARMGNLAKKEDQYKLFEDKCDLLLRRNHFAIMQRGLRDYILRQRFPGLIVAGDSR